MENDLLAGSRLDEPVGVDKIAVKLKTGIVENKVNTPALEVGDVVGQLVQVVSKNVLFSVGEVLATSGLKLLDVLLGHVDEKRKIGRVTPKTDLSQLEEEETVLLAASLCGNVVGIRYRVREARSELKDSLGGAREGVALLTEEDVYDERGAQICNSP